jgi:AraC-like DNA-binding protein
MSVRENLPDFFQSLQRFLTNLELSTGITFCFRDYSNVTRRLLPKERYNHNCAYCKWVKKDKLRDQKCWLQDFILLRTVAEKAKEPYIRYCHAGVCEAIVPIKELDSGRLFGVIFCGQVATANSNLLSRDKRLLHSMPTVTERKLMAVAHVVDEFCRATISISSAIAESQRLYVGPNETVKKALALMAERFREEITLSDVAKAVSLSPSRFAHVLKDVTGQGFTAILRSLRMTEVHQLLALTDIKIQEIATRVGFEDTGYFHRLFKKTHKMTPSEYRELVRVKDVHPSEN